MHGVPDWYKEMLAKRNSFPTNTTAEVATGSSTDGGPKATKKDDFYLKAFIKNEVKMLMTTTQDSPMSYGNAIFEHIGNIYNNSSIPLPERTWLLNSGASCHIAAHKSLLMSLTPLKTKPLISLPDGTNYIPKYNRSFYISPYIIREHVDFIQEFKVNLLYLSCLVIHHLCP